VRTETGWFGYKFIAKRKLIVPKSPGWSLTQCFYLVMGGFVIKSDDQLIRASPKNLLKLLDTDVLSWPEVTTSEIEDRSKADWILKSLALAQAVWFLAQCIGRAVQGLSMTTLELFTLGIISCALVTYSAWWSKPFDVRKPIIIEPKSALPKYVKQIRKMGFSDKYESLPQTYWPTVLGVCATQVFAALHFVGWQFHFPTETEKWFWRASCIACVVLPLAVVFVSVWDIEDGWNENWLTGFFVILYTLCRVYMMVEMFISLRAVPADVYETPQWSQYFPSLG
jgi:hypothetical protein